MLSRLPLHFHTHNQPLLYLQGAVVGCWRTYRNSNTLWLDTYKCISTHHDARQVPQLLKQSGAPPSLCPVTERERTTNKNDAEKIGSTLAIWSGHSNICKTSCNTRYHNNQTHYILWREKLFYGRLESKAKSPEARNNSIRLSGAYDEEYVVKYPNSDGEYGVSAFPCV